MAFQTLPELQAYYTSLGRFTHAYAGIEVQLRLLAHQYSGMEWEMAKIMFAGDKTEGFKDKIKAFRKAKGLPTESRLDETFVQISHLQKARNLILHFQPQYCDGFVVSTNRYHVKSEQAIFEIVITPELLDRMSDDCETVSWVLSIHTLSQFAPEIRDTSMKPFLPQMLERAHAPWRYTLGPRDVLTQHILAKSQEQQLPPQP